MNNNHSAWIEIDINRLKKNFALIRKYIPPKVSITTPIKSNAYGHGLIEVAKGLIEAGSERLALSSVSEGVILRKAGITHPLFCLYPIMKKDVINAVTYDIQVATGNSSYDRSVIKRLSKEAKKQEKKALMHIIIDTGLGRYGANGWDRDDVLSLYRLINEDKYLSLIGIGMQFANAEDHDMTRSNEQLQQFKARLKNIEDAGYVLPQEIHAANSASILQFPNAYFTVVRPGLINYGYQPAPKLPLLEGLEPVMTVKSRISRIRIFPKGHSIGYGMTRRIEKETKIAFIPFGYEYGFDRAFSDNGYVLVKGQKAYIVGNISMNSVALDISSINNVEPEEEVVIIGKQGKEEIKLQEWATFLRTNVNELMVRFSLLLPRIFIYVNTLQVKANDHRTNLQK